MAFKNSPFHFQMVDVSMVDPDPGHIRQSIGEEALKGLTNAVRKLGIIHPVIVRPGSGDRFVVIAGERRRQAAIQAGETQLPVIVGERIVGGLTDAAIRDYTIEQTKTRKKTYEEVMRTRIEEIMDAPFPILNEDTPIDLASFHLQREEAILVSRKGAIVGILTSADFLNLGLNQ